MPLDPQQRKLLERNAAAPVQPERSVGELRRSVALGSARTVEDRMIPGPAGDIPIRIYVPPGRRPLPVLVFFHGGGWVHGSIEGSDLRCRLLSEWSGCAIVSVDYQLAPEHAFPAAADDCYAATVWASVNAASFGGDPTRLGVGGDSAGGNLAAAVTLMARDRGGPPLAFQYLAYPITDHNFDTSSYQENSAGYGLSRDMMMWYWDQYVPNPADRTNPLVSPLRAPNLRGLPPAFIITAEYDPLRDEGEAYARRLQEAGVPVEHKRYPGVVHGFIGMAAELDAGKDALKDLAWALRKGLGQASE